jgi:hypothetical protein
MAIIGAAIDTGAPGASAALANSQDAPNKQRTRCVLPRRMIAPSLLNPVITIKAIGFLAKHAPRCRP